MMHDIYMLGVAPTSWVIGVWRKPHKTIYAFGPFRCAVFHDVGAWK